jgi:hypothetical protein
VVTNRCARATVSLMSAVGSGEGMPGGPGDWPADDTAARRLGAFAAHVLENLYVAVFGERPVGVRAWCDGATLLMVLRIAGPVDHDQPPLAGLLPCDAIPELVVTALQAQAGCAVTVGSWSIEADLGLAMFVFNLPRGRGLPFAIPVVGEPITAPGEVEHEQARPQHWTARRVPSWRTWSPVPGSGIHEHDSPLERRARLRLVED